MEIIREPAGNIHVEKAATTVHTNARLVWIEFTLDAARDEGATGGRVRCELHDLTKVDVQVGY